MPRPSARSTWVVLLLWGATGCQRAAQPVQLDAKMYLADTSALAKASYPNVVLVFKASQCLSCSVNISTWIELRRQHPERVKLLLTGMPDSASAIVLARSRIPIDGVLRSADGLSAVPPYALIADGPQTQPRVVSVERWTAANLAPSLARDSSHLIVDR